MTIGNVTLKRLLCERIAPSRFGSPTGGAELALSSRRSARRLWNLGHRFTPDCACGMTAYYARVSPDAEYRTHEHQDKDEDEKSP